MWEDWSAAEEDTAAPSSVLVAVVPSVRDWERVQQQGWYRIPERRAPRRIGSQYLAFYLPGCFGEQRWSIRSYAPIRQYTLLTRGELLPEEPAHPRAAQLYYRLDLGPLQSLPHPIPSLRLRRVTFIHTDLATLLRAREIGDLWCHEDDKTRLWRGLRLSSPTVTYRLHAA